MNAVNATSQALLGQLPILTSFGRKKPVDNGLLCGLHLQKNNCKTHLQSRIFTEPLFKAVWPMCERQQLFGKLGFLVQRFLVLKVVLFFRKRNGSLMKLAKLPFNTVVREPSKTDLAKGRRQLKDINYKAATYVKLVFGQRILIQVGRREEYNQFWQPCCTCPI